MHKRLGYKSIGVVVGTSQGNVRYYYKMHGLAGRPQFVELNFEEHKNHPLVCQHCGGATVRNRHSGKKLFARIIVGASGGNSIWWRARKLKR